MRKSVNSELKVKHPYSYLIKVILLGIVMLFSGIFSAVMINEISHSPDNGVYASWGTTCPNCGAALNIRNDLTNALHDYSPNGATPCYTYGLCSVVYECPNGDFTGTHDYCQNCSFDNWDDGSGGSSSYKTVTYYWAQTGIGGTTTGPEYNFTGTSIDCTDSSTSGPSTTEIYVECSDGFTGTIGLSSYYASAYSITVIFSDDSFYSCAYNGATGYLSDPDGKISYTSSTGFYVYASSFSKTITKINASFSGGVYNYCGSPSLYFGETYYFVYDSSGGGGEPPVEDLYYWFGIVTNEGTPNFIGDIGQSLYATFDFKSDASGYQFNSKGTCYLYRIPEDRIEDSWADDYNIIDFYTDALSNMYDGGGTYFVSIDAISGISNRSYLTLHKNYYTSCYAYCAGESGYIPNPTTRNFMSSPIDGVYMQIKKSDLYYGSAESEVIYASGKYNAENPMDYITAESGRAPGATMTMFFPEGDAEILTRVTSADSSDKFKYYYNSSTSSSLTNDLFCYLGDTGTTTTWFDVSSGYKPNMKLTAELRYGSATGTVVHSVSSTSSSGVKLDCSNRIESSGTTTNETNQRYIKYSWENIDAYFMVVLDSYAYNSMNLAKPNVYLNNSSSPMTAYTSEVSVNAGIGWVYKVSGYSASDTIKITWSNAFSGDYFVPVGTYTCDYLKYYQNCYLKGSNSGSATTISHTGAKNKTVSFTFANSSYFSSSSTTSSMPEIIMAYSGDPGKVLTKVTSTGGNFTFYYNSSNYSSSVSSLYCDLSSSSSYFYIGGNYAEGDSLTGVLKYGSTIIDEKTYDHNTAQANMKLTNKVTSSLTTPRTITITKGTDSSYQFSIAIDSAGDSTSGSYKFNNGTSYSTGQTLSGTLRGNSINLTFPSKTYYAHVTITNGNSAGNYYVVSSSTLINTTSTGRGSAPTTNNFTMLADTISVIAGNS